MKLAKPTATAAIPTRLCRMATSSGICVIWTRRAAMIPTVPPTSSATIRSSKFCFTSPSNVATSAIAIPMMPYQLPRLAVSWLDRPPRARMNRMVAMMYETWMIPWFTSNITTSLSEHFKHAASYRKTAEDIDGCDQYGADGDPLDHGNVGTDLEQGADHDNARDRVGDTHERRMQGRRHVPDHHVADKTGEYENREMRHERRRCYRTESEQ